MEGITDARYQHRVTIHTAGRAMGNYSRNLDQRAESALVQVERNLPSMTPVYLKYYKCFLV